MVALWLNVDEKRLLRYASQIEGCEGCIIRGGFPHFGLRFAAASFSDALEGISKEHIHGDIPPFPGAIISVARGCPIDADRAGFAQACQQRLNFNVKVLRSWVETTQGPRGPVETRAFRLASQEPPPQASWDTADGIIVFGKPTPKGGGKGAKGKGQGKGKAPARRAPVPVAASAWGPPAAPEGPSHPPSLAPARLLSRSRS